VVALFGLGLGIITNSQTHKLTNSQTHKLTDRRRCIGNSLPTAIESMVGYFFLIGHRGSFHSVLVERFSERQSELIFRPGSEVGRPRRGGVHGAEDSVAVRCRRCNGRSFDSWF
jgi:hypothetical protein